MTDISEADNFNITALKHTQIQETDDESVEGSTDNYYTEDDEGEHM